MATSIGKLSKSFFLKLFVGIIILPFIFWGMGDVFSGGNKNVVATIDSKKVSTQEFVNHLKRLNLSDEQLKNLPNTDLIEKILSEYIGRKVMKLEIKDLGISINDNSLRNILKNDDLFLKDKKFSRTKYEKFLLESGITAPDFEANIVEQESRRQLLSSLSSGISIPDTLIEKAYRKENQIKTIKYINLEKFYNSKKIPEKELKSLYEKNKEIFKEKYKTINFSEITPLSLTGGSDFDEVFFKQLDKIENNILDGQNFEEAIKENNLLSKKIESINAQKEDERKNKIEILSDEVFEKAFNIKNVKTPEILKSKNKYFLVEIESIKEKLLLYNDPKVLELLNAQLSFQNKIESNRSILKDISVGGFDSKKIKEFADKNNLSLKDYVVSDLKQNEIFSEGIIKRIFLTQDGKVDLVTNSTLTKSFLILPINTKYKTLKKSSSEYERYEAKARLDLINTIYRTFDKNLNSKYDVEINQRTVERVKNSF